MKTELRELKEHFLGKVGTNNRDDYEKDLLLLASRMLRDIELDEIRKFRLYTNGYIEKDKISLNFFRARGVDYSNTKPIYPKDIFSKKQRQVISLVGSNKTGKQATALQLVRQYKKMFPKNKVIAFDPQDIFLKEGIIDEKITVNTDLNILLRKKKGKYVYQNYLLVLPSYRILNPSESINNVFLELLHSRTDKKIDIIFTCHNPSLILTRLGHYVTKHLIFHNFRNEGVFSKGIPNYVLCEQAIIIINKYVEAYNLLEKGKDIYPYFPHLLVGYDNNINSIEMINIDKEKFTNINK